MRYIYHHIDTQFRFVQDFDEIGRYEPLDDNHGAVYSSPYRGPPDSKLIERNNKEAI